jgi:hypothetical protein
MPKSRQWFAPDFGVLHVVDFFFGLAPRRTGTSGFPFRKAHPNVGRTTLSEPESAS